MSDLRALEHSTLKVPYEVLNKKFRIAQKTMDRESSHVLQTAKALMDVMGGETVKVGEGAEVAAALLDRLQTLAARVSSVVANETEAAALIKRRIHHLKVSTDPEATATAVEQWRKVRVERLIVEYLLRAGYHETACQLADKSGLAYMSNLQMFLVAEDVHKSLERKETAKCLEWCYDNRSKLRRLHSTLELHVRQQEFVELLRREHRLDAVKYARKFFSGVDDDSWKSELAQFLGLVAFGADTQIASYRNLLAEDRWTDLMAEFRQENFRLYQLAHQSVFSACFQCGLSALKTPQCCEEGVALSVGGGATKKQCPVCLPDVQTLASPLPYAHAAQSRLICAFSGETLDENNPGMMLPNGMVYGQRALQFLAVGTDGTIVCPRTGIQCSIDQALRIYVM